MLEAVKQGDRTEDFEPFKGELPDDQCRCAAYLFHYVHDTKRHIVKELLINWAPDGATKEVGL